MLLGTVHWQQAALVPLVPVPQELLLWALVR